MVAILTETLSMNTSFPNFSIIFFFPFPSPLAGVLPLKYNVFFQSSQDSLIAQSYQNVRQFCLSLARGFVLVVLFRICRICFSFWSFRAYFGGFVSFISLVSFRLFRWFRFVRVGGFGAWFPPVPVSFRSF